MIHNTRHGVLTRYPMQTLVSMGESVKRLRKTEAFFRAELKPAGPIGTLLFDRMFSSYLRCLLAQRLEAIAMAPISRQNPEAPGQTAEISAEELPTLIIHDMADQNLQSLSPDLLSELALVQKYDSHFSRDMFRCLGLLLVLKNGGEEALAKCICKSLGAHKDPSEG